MRNVAVTVRYLGDFSLCVNGSSQDCWRAGKTRNLLQYMLLNRDRVVRRETLFETLWPGSVWSPTTSLLKVAMHSVRRALSEAVGSDGPLEIISRDHGYLLRTTGVWLDVNEFDDGMAAGRAAEARGDNTVAVSAYRRAAELYAGDFLPAEAADWVAAQRQCYRTLQLYALTYLRADAMRRGDHPTVIELCRRILDIDPYHEEMYQSLMLLHGLRGELGQVRNWHQLCVRRLRDGLDLAPAETTRRIFTRAVRGELRPAGRSLESVA